MYEVLYCLGIVWAVVTTGRGGRDVFLRQHNAETISEDFVMLSTVSCTVPRVIYGGYMVNGF